MTKIAETLTGLHRTLILLAAVLILFARGDDDTLKFTRAEAKIKAVFEGHAEVIDEVDAGPASEYHRHVVAALPAAARLAGGDPAWQGFVNAIVKAQVTPEALDIVDTRFPAVSRGQPAIPVVDQWRLPLEPSTLSMHDLEKFLWSGPRRVTLQRYDFVGDAPARLSEMLVDFFRRDYADRGGSVVSVINAPEDGETCSISLHLVPANGAGRPWRKYSLPCRQSAGPPDDLTRILRGYFDDTDYADSDIPFVKDLNKKRYPAIASEFARLAAREATPADRSVEILGLKLSAPVVRTFVPLAIVGVLLQMLALLGIASRHSAGQKLISVSTDALAWFDLARGWTIISVIVSVIILPASAIIFAVIPLPPYSLLREYVAQAPLQLVCALAAVILSVTFVVRSNRFAAKLMPIPDLPLQPQIGISTDATKS